MPHFDQKDDPLSQLTPLLDPVPYEDTFTIKVRSLTLEKSPL